MAELLESGDGCAARSEAEALQAEAITAVNGRRVPRPFQEQLLGSVTALVEAIECVAPPPPVEEDEADAEDEDNEDDETPGKGRGRGKQKAKDKD